MLNCAAPECAELGSFVLPRLIACRYRNARMRDKQQHSDLPAKAQSTCRSLRLQDTLLTVIQLENNSWEQAVSRRAW